MQVLKESEDEERKKRGQEERRENYDRNLLGCTQCNFVGPKRANKQL